MVRQPLEKPRTVKSWELEVNKKLFGPHFKKDNKAVESALLETTQEQREAFSKDLQSKGKIVVDVPKVGKAEVGQELIKAEFRESTQHTREYTPNVIEPSFGIGRIFTAVCEHNYWVRDGDEARGVRICGPA